jgi:hypothetical protein
MRTRGLCGAIIVMATASAAQAEQPPRQFVKLAAGEHITLYGNDYVARAPTLAVSVLSSEFLTVAVLDGTLADAKIVAKAGEALVTPLDGKGTQRFAFDARRLAATLPPQWATEVGPSLDRVAARQKRARFWGRLEPVNVNATAPTSPQLEGVRASYLGNDTIVALRREANGNPQTLAALTAKRFAEALAAGDARAVADLIDPKPFTASGATATAWQAARLDFATKLTTDPALNAAMTSAPGPVAGDQTAFDTGGYRIRLVPRDRAMFVTAVERL